MKKKKLERTIYKLELIRLEIQFEIDEAVDSNDVKHLIPVVKDLDTELAKLKAQLEVL